MKGRTDRFAGQFGGVSPQGPNIQLDEVCRFGVHGEIERKAMPQVFLQGTQSVPRRIELAKGGKPNRSRWASRILG
jgi:hypothetical protein